MLIKPLWPRDTIERLEQLKAAYPSHAPKLDEEIRKTRAGEKAERDAAYQIDFKLKDSKNYAVLHDLRLELNGRVAQIDHLVINRRLHCFVLETKSCKYGLRITEEGEFHRWNDWKKEYQPFASPIRQCDRHIQVLKDAITSCELAPKRLGVRLRPQFTGLVLVDPSSRVERPKKFDTSPVVTFDAFFEPMNEEKDGLKAAAEILNMVSSDTLGEFANAVARLHTPIKMDFEGMLGIRSDTLPAPEAHASKNSAPYYAESAIPALPSKTCCKDCKGHDIDIQYGKFGYYWKCRSCDANTKIVLPGKGRLRKVGSQFFFVADSGGESLFHVNT